MKTILLLSVIFSSLAQAEKKIAMSEVASAFAWIKLAPELPIIFTTESEDVISFRIFNDVFTLTREKLSYKISRFSYLQNENHLREEVALVDAITIEKILRFVKAKKRANALMSPDVFKESIQEEKLPVGFQKSLSIFQCKSDLPSRITRNGSPINQILQHTWIQNGPNESFGMPNTDDSGYFGGRAHIRTPDSFLNKGPRHLQCAPVFIPADQDEKIVSKKITCLAKSLSMPQDPVFMEDGFKQKWIAHFDYHALERNCLLAVRFILECSGAKAPQVVNSGIGGKLDWSDPYSMSEVSLDLRQAISEIQNQLKIFRNQQSISQFSRRAEELMDQAMEIDNRLRGASGVPSPKNLRQLCDLALEDLDPCINFP